ncbi:MAG: hypothetical protein AAB620_02785 [Patescibacteria group bacterium]
MQVLELHFNPKARPDVFFDSFCYEPENIYEKRLGSLYIIGELTRANPKNSRLLDELASTIKARHYGLTSRSSAFALREALKSANKFLAELVREGNVDWLGNLNCALLSVKQTIANDKASFVFNFTKVGKIKILLVRGKTMVEIGQELEITDMEPYPLKVFFNTASGKLKENDRLIVASDDFMAENQVMAVKIGSLSSFEPSRLRDVFLTAGKEPQELAGLCFTLALTKENLDATALTYQKKQERFPKAKSFAANFYNFVKKPLFKNFAGKINIIKNLDKKIEDIQKTEVKKPLAMGVKAIIRSWVNPIKNLRKLKISRIRPALSILLLAVILISGFFVFRADKNKAISSAGDVLQTAKNKIGQAENFLVLGEDEKANQLLQEAWKIVAPETKKGAILAKEAGILKQDIENKLVPLNKMEIVENPDIFYELKTGQTKLVPQRLFLLDSELYFSNPAADSLFQINVNAKESKVMAEPKKFSLAGAFKGGLVVLTRQAADDVFLTVFNGEGWLPQKIKTVSPSFGFDAMSVFTGADNSVAAYILDCQTGQVVKYAYLGNNNWAGPRVWLDKAPNHFCPEKTPQDGALAADGSLWFLRRDNGVERYYAGYSQDAYAPVIFPFLEKPTKIWTSSKHSYLYILEPDKDRLVLLDKKGRLIKQYFSQKFDNLLDFAVSADTKTIWLLNGSTVFKLAIQ